MGSGKSLANYVPAVGLSQGVIGMSSYTVATVPTAANYTGGIIYVTNGAAGSPCLAVCDGTNWLRCDTLAAISAT